MFVTFRSKLAGHKQYERPEEISVLACYVRYHMIHVVNRFACKHESANEGDE